MVTVNSEEGILSERQEKSQLCDLNCILKSGLGLRRLRGEENEINTV